MLVCDDCAVTGGDEPHQDDGYTLHFTSETDALRCRRCSAQHFCGHLGHFYDLWQPCTCRGQLPAHATTGCPLIRACIYCGHHDLALLANLPTH